MMGLRFGLDYEAATFVTHGYAESRVDLGEIEMNYAESGSRSAPPLILVPGQAESWWGYEAVMKLLEDDFNVFVVDLRGQGRSSRTPGRYTVDNMGDDLARFLLRVVGRPAVVCGHSSGGVLAAWLAAYGPPGAVAAVFCEDAPFFVSEVAPAIGPGMRQSAIGLLFKLWARHLGPQWRVGDWSGLMAAQATELPPWFAPLVPASAGPSQSMKEYDPEWAQSFWSGAATASCDQAAMLERIRVPVLFTHHSRYIHAETGMIAGAISDFQLGRVRAIVTGNDVPFTCHSFPEMPHSMHGASPNQYATVVRQWHAGLASLP